MIPPSSNPYVLAGGACFALAGAAFDLSCRRIPNWLTGAAFIVALALRALSGGVRGFLDSLAAGLIAGAIFAVMFFMGGMGGGDVKLMAAIAAFAGLARLAPLLLSTALAGGILALIVAVVHGAFGHMLRRALAWIWPAKIPVDSSVAARLYLPYGVPIAMGALLTFYCGVPAL